MDGQPIIENRTSVIEVRYYGSMVFYAKTGYLPDDEEVINTGGGIFKVGRNALTNMLKRLNSK